MMALGSGEQLELLALGRYVLERADSPVLVVLTGAPRLSGMFLAPFASALADRVNRRSSLLAVTVALRLPSLARRA